MDHFPIELIERIALFMDLCSLGRFTATSSQNAAILNSMLFWKLYFAVNYPRCAPRRDLKLYCRIMPSMWTDNAAGVILKMEQTATLLCDEFSYKTLAYDRSNRFGVMGGHGSPLLSFRVNEDLTLLPLDQYNLPDTPRTLTPSRICLDDRFIVVLESTGNIVIFNKQTGELFTEIENEIDDAPYYAAEPSTELHFDRERIFCAKDGVVQMWDFETGQKITERATETYGPCHYANTSGMCFISDGTRISALDMRLSHPAMVTAGIVSKNFGFIRSIKYYDNRLYCGTNSGNPVALELRYSTLQYPQFYSAKGSLKRVTMHVDAYRVILGTENQIQIYDRYSMKKRFTFKFKGDVRNYSFQDSYILVDTNTSTTLYSVTDVLYRTNGVLTN